MAGLCERGNEPPGSLKATIPCDWKSAIVVPIYKGGNKLDAGNYRPISLTSVVCKVMEHLISDYIRQVLNAKDWFYNRQHSFREGFSCDSQITSLVQDLAEECTLMCCRQYTVHNEYVRMENSVQKPPAVRIISNIFSLDKICHRSVELCGFFLWIKFAEDVLNYVMIFSSDKICYAILGLVEFICYNSAGHHGAGRNVANSQETTAEACGVDMRAVQRIVSEGNKSFNVSGTATFRSPGKHPRREKTVSELDDFNKSVLRRTVLDMYLRESDSEESDGTDEEISDFD
ncbi:hypothetical protein ANN_16099 [Periplaneta americana]|uniref:Reverse transcriptase domain-containing protein n=1 Tax=Periplaneta americana TaxID=6978 RepID=A0ABQ8SJ92_PERAM|nr:hypothetical protein ANN_16099 [Periplaneta americana]